MPCGRVDENGPGVDETAPGSQVSDSNPSGPVSCGRNKDFAELAER